LRCSRAVRRRGIGRQLQRTASGSTHHDRVTARQICSSYSRPLDRPRQSTPRYPPPAANRLTTYRVRRHPPLIRQPPNRRATRCINSIHISQIARATQIPTAPAAPPYVPSSAVSLYGLCQGRSASEAQKVGHRIERIAVAFEAGRDGFWLARWLRARDI